MKRTISVINIVEVAVYVIIAGLIIYGKILGMKSYEAFLTLTKEDGIAEYLTALFLFASAIVFLVKSIRTRRGKNYKMLAFNLLLFLLFFFATGEEISWGQRIFNLRSGDFFLEKNTQDEINFHNLKFGGIAINKLVFSQLMFAAIIFYFVLLKFLVRLSSFFRKVVLMFDIPVPRYHHVMVLLISALLVIFIHLKRESELYELALSGIFFLVFLHPANVSERNEGS